MRVRALTCALLIEPAVEAVERLARPARSRTSDWVGTVGACMPSRTWRLGDHLPSLREHHYDTLWVLAIDAHAAATDIRVQVRDLTRRLRLHLPTAAEAQTAGSDDRVAEALCLRTADSQATRHRTGSPKSATDSHATRSPRVTATPIVPAHSMRAP
jgi:hypothetical protein